MGGNLELEWSPAKVLEVILQRVVLRSKIEIGREICGRYPGVHHWEHHDPRLLVCEAYLSPNTASKIPRFNEKNKSVPPPKKVSSYQAIGYDEQQQKAAIDQLNKTAECLIVSVFFNSDHGLLVYDSYARGEIYSKLISVRIPYHFFVTKVSLQVTQVTSC